MRHMGGTREPTLNGDLDDAPAVVFAKELTRLLQSDQPNRSCNRTAKLLEKAAFQSATADLGVLKNLLQQPGAR
ncbi:MAG: hypothetical protein O3A00_01890 [Planctomycetota bacterium]|nr:hypothetical protein [Planctomycetota bacterium]